MKMQFKELKKMHEEHMAKLNREILKIKDWKENQDNTQFTILPTGSIYMHKCKQIIKLDNSYKCGIGGLIIFTKANSDLIHLEYSLLNNRGNIMHKNGINADGLQYTEERGFY